MQAVELLKLKREHAERLANQGGAAGELEALIARPRGPALGLLMVALRESGIVIKNRVAMRLLYRLL